MVTDNKVRKSGRNKDMACHWYTCLLPVIILFITINEVVWEVTFLSNSYSKSKASSIVIVAKRKFEKYTNNEN